MWLRAVHQQTRWSSGRSTNGDIPYKNGDVPILAKQGDILLYTKMRISHKAKSMGISPFRDIPIFSNIGISPLGISHVLDISSYIFHGILYQMSLYLNGLLPISHEISVAFFSWIYPIRYRISHGISNVFLVSFIAILACSPAFEFVNFLCYAMRLIIPNLRIARKYCGHTFIYWTHRSKSWSQ